MHIIPVLDLQSGQVVHAIGGRRREYRPLTSLWTQSVEPREVARALRDRFGFRTFYLADLDAIEGTRPPATSTYEAIQELDCELWVDAGIRNEKDAELLAGQGIEGIVIGLETLQGPDVLQAISARFLEPPKGGPPSGARRTGGRRTGGRGSCRAAETARAP